ncbi:MAG: hypothetical protein ACJ74H_20680 [Thermoanaerobaculia bacterium]
MSVVRLVPRLIVLSASVLLVSGCARPAPGPNPIRPIDANPCAAGVPAASKQAPIVCIDDSNRTLVAIPDRVVVHDVKEADRTSPVQIEWYTISGTGDVHVRMKPGCTAVKPKTCNGNGKCEAETVPGSRTECKYDVWITGGKHDLLDPTIVVDPCCG